MEAAWEEGLLDSLPGNVKARFSAATFVDGPPGSIALALPNDIHRQRCEDVRQAVDDAFTQRFGQPVPLVLVTEGTPVPNPAHDGEAHAAPASPGPAPPAPDPPGPGSLEAAPTPPQAEQTSPAPSAPSAPGNPGTYENMGRDDAAASPAYDAASQPDDPYPEEAIDLHALTDATNVSSSVIDRITEAFPGTQVLNEEDEPR